MTEPERPSRLLQGLEDLPRPFIDEAAGGGPDQDADATPPADPLEEAYARGFDAGREEGRQRAAEAHQQQVEDFRREMAAALKQLTELHERLTDEYKSLMLELGLEAASSIVRERIEADDPVAARALAKAIEALPGSETVKARLHPDDVCAVERELADLIARQRVELLSDESVSRGGCIVDSRAGRIDATIETATEEVRAAAEGRQVAP